MHWRSDNIKLRSDNDANEVIDELLESLRSGYQWTLEILMRGNDFIFESVQLMYYKYHKVNFRRGGSYNDSPNWIKATRKTQQ